MIASITPLLTGFSGGVAITLVVVLYFVFNPEKFQKWSSMIAWLVSRIWKNAEYYAIKNEVQGKINGFVSSLESSTTAKFPRIKLQWANQGEDEVMVWEEDTAILLMRDRTHKVKNFVHAVYFFTSESLLRKSKKHLSKSQKTSIDLFATKQILEQTSGASVEQFMTDYFLPHIEKNDSIRELIKQYVNVEQLGIFFPILVQELSYLGHKVFLHKPSNEVIEEVKSLVKFLEDFSQREVGDITTPDTFVGKYTRCAIRIVASKQVREKGDITSHTERVSNCIEKGYENVYLIGVDERKNRNFMDSVADAVQVAFQDVQNLKNYKFSGKIKMRGELVPVKTYMIHLHNPSATKYIYKEEDVSQEDIEQNIVTV